MDKIDNMIHKAKGIISHAIDRRDLKEGDQIYVYRSRATFIYSHHGIYVAEDTVIHYVPTARTEGSSSICTKCKYQKGVHVGVVRTCLDCFIDKDNALAGTTLRLCMYGVSPTVRMISKLGSCHMRPSRPANEVVITAYKCYEKKIFGEYNLIFNNCEDFATFCKTGEECSAQVEGVGITLMAYGIGGIALAGAGAATYYAKKKREKARENGRKIEN